MFEDDEDDDDLTARPPSFGGVFGAVPPGSFSGKKKDAPPPPGRPSGLFGGLPSPPGPPSPSGPRFGTPPPRPVGIGLPRMTAPSEHDVRWKPMNFHLKADLEIFHTNIPLGALPRVTIIPQAERLLRRRLFVIRPFEPGWVAVKVVLEKRPPLIGFVHADTLILQPAVTGTKWPDLLLHEFSVNFSVADALMWLSAVIVVVLLLNAALSADSASVLTDAALTELQALVQAQGDRIQQLETQINQLLP